MQRNSRERQETYSNSMEPALPFNSQTRGNYMFPKTIVLPKFRVKKLPTQTIRDEGKLILSKEGQRLKASKPLRTKSRNMKFMLNEIRRREVVQEATVEEENDSRGSESKPHNKEDSMPEEKSVSEIEQLTSKHIVLPKIKELKATIAKLVIKDHLPSENKTKKPIAVKLGEILMSERTLPKDGHITNEQYSMNSEREPKFKEPPRFFAADPNRKIWRHKLPEPPEGFPCRKQNRPNETRSLNMESRLETENYQDQELGHEPKKRK